MYSSSRLNSEIRKEIISEGLYHIERDTFMFNSQEIDLIVDKLEDIKGYVSHQNFSKVYMYLSAVCGYSSDQD